MNTYSTTHEYPLNTKGSTWIAANAGSGKTYVLARRVVRLLLDGARSESIICLTYTKAAASEMRERILALLKNLMVAEEDSLHDVLFDILGESATDAHKRRAPQLLDEVLDSPLGGLHITTIHGFCQQILGSFPLEAGISPHAQLLDDREQNEIIQQAVRRLLVADDSIVTHSLSFIAEISAEGRLNQWLTRLIYQRSEWQVLTQLPTHEAMKQAIESRYPLDSYVRDVWQKRLYETPDEVLKMAAQILSGGSATQQQLAAVLTQWLTDKSNLDAYILAWLTKDSEPRKNIAKPFEKAGGLATDILREQQRVYEIVQALGAIACAEETYHMAVLARAIHQTYNQIKQTRSVLDYEDLIGHIEILFSRDLPWVMTKLDYRIDHLLLDEAQDTSPAQWRISEALVKELFSVNSPSGQPRSLFVVGDEKQSIYSFQGAAPEMFAQMREDWRQTMPIESFALSKSYRSTQPILDMAHAICGVGHSLHREGEAGSVELWPLIEQPEKQEVEPYHIPTEYSDEERGEALLALQIAGTIRSWLDEKRQLVAHARAVQAGDIMILVHRRKPMTPLLIKALQRLNIPVAGIDRLALSSHLAVKDMIALMRWVFTPEDDLALAQILRSPLIGMNEEALFKVAHGRGEASLWRQVNHVEVLQYWRDARYKTPYQFLHQLLEVEGKRSAYAIRFGHEIHEVLDELLEHAAACEAEPMSLLNYAQQLEQAGREIKREMTGADQHDEVRILTVHGAKGLEAPIVILADTTSAPDLKKEMWFEGPTVAITDEAKNAPFLEALKEARRAAMQREYERLLYVAITRAEDECYIAGVKPSRQKIDSSWYALCLDAIKTIEGVTEDVGTYRITSKQTKPIKANESEAQTTAPLPDWAKLPVISETKEGFFSPSRLTSSELALYDKTEGDARTRGVLIHQLLELASGNPAKDIIQKLAHFIAPDWSNTERDAMVRDVYGLLTNAELAWLWNSEGYNEVSVSGVIMVNGQPQRMNGQIDRLVIQGNNIVVLDYKTSANVPKTIAETKPAYVLQMKAYRELLASKYKGKTIRCALLWTHAPRLDWLDDLIEAYDWDKSRQVA